MLRRTLVAALVVLAPMAADWSGVLNPIEDRLTAARMEMQRRAPTGEVVVVDIDAKSIAAVGSWPWPRRVYAELIDKLVALGASEIAIDVDFSAPSNPIDDAALEASLKSASGTVILAAFAQNLTAGPDARPTYNHPLERFAANSWVASVNVRPDPDGQVRSFSYGLIVDGQVVPSVPVILGGGLGEAGQGFPIDFSIDARAIDRIPLIDVVHGEVDQSRIAGKKVIVGAQATELRDFFNVPVAGPISGALLQAAATETLLQGRALHQTSAVVDLAGLIAIAIAAFAIGRRRWSVAIAALAATIVILETAATVLQAMLAIAVNTAPWHLALVFLAVIVLVSEINFRQLLQAVWRVRARNAQTLLAQVVADNFAGIVVIDDRERIRASSHAAAAVLGCRHDLAGSTAPRVLPPELVTRVREMFGQPEGESNARADGLVEFRRDDGETRVLEYVITLSRADVSPSGDHREPKTHRIACLTFTDITERRAAEARIARMAHFDTLTELPNRNQLVEQIQTALADGGASRRSCAIVCFDLDGFKNVNDTLGHNNGDLLLREVAARAVSLLPSGALVARLGGDEFAAIVSGEDADRLAIGYAENVVGHISEPFEINRHHIIIAASAGVALADSGDAAPDDVLKRADVALYRAKSNGGNGIAIFEPKMLETVAKRQRLELELWQAFERKEFEVWYQPQVHLLDARMTGVEALLRWRHPQRGVVFPSEFIPVAEAIGLIEDLGRWVLETACMDAATWPEPISLSVNVSSVQFVRSDIVEVVSRALARSGLAPSRLDLEITESLFMQPNETVHSALHQLRSLGVGIALDDFGTGYSSLSYIHKFPISKIKLDKSFVSGLPMNVGSAAIVRAVSALAKDLEIILNAEGVENPEQAAFLKLLGVAEGQGYLYGRPQPAADIVRLLEIPDQVALLRA